MSNETYRPQFHFTPEAGWINDPNGLVYFRGEWHLFYQFSEPSLAEGMMWGHAVSDDLLHWQHLPPAIVPDRHGVIWSGSAVVDHHDTSGLFGGGAGMVCLFTYFDRADGYQSQGLAYSLDGRNFTVYDGNPVISKLADDKDVRDPKVFWHGPTGRWIMAIAGGKLRIFSSKNLIDWQFESIAPTILTECPDLFPLPIDSNPKRQQWLLSGGGRWYMLGDFDGQTFTPTSEAIPMNFGPDFYATQTWSNAPAGRRIAITWLFHWQYESNANDGIIKNAFPTSWAGGSLTVPQELTLRTTPAGVRLFQNPVAELETLRDRLTERSNFTLNPAGKKLGVIAGQSLDVRVAFKTAAKLSIAFPAAKSEYTLTYDAAAQQLTLDRTAARVQTPAKFPQKYEAPLPPQADSSVELRLLIDHSCIEVFGNGGAVTLTAFVLPDPSLGGLSIEAIGAPCEIQRLEIDVIRSAVG
jgi:sucrose-6-phosphate hydrolase SacC (GH32 family)